MTYERFCEYVAATMKQHISRDKYLVPADQEWETDNFCDRLAHLLRMEGAMIENKRPLPKQRDLSEFETR